VPKISTKTHWVSNPGEVGEILFLDQRSASIRIEM